MADRDPTLAVEALADTVLPSSTVAIVAVDLDGRVVLWNRGATRLFGWTEEEATDRFLPFMPPEREAEYMELFERLRAGEEFDELEMPYRTRSGERSSLVVSLRPLRGADGESRAIVGVAKQAGDPESADRLLRRIDVLENRLAEAHLPPHFLLNSLHAIGVLVREQRPEDAVRMLSRLGDILREAIRRPGEDETSLAEEIRLTRKYVEVEQARYGPELRLEVDVPEEALYACVPRMVLQPLVENAIRHGLAPRGGRGTIRVEARLREGALILGVTDDGIGLTPEAERRRGGGIGLTATRSRLRRLYGDAGELRLEAREGSEEGGARAVVRLPVREREEQLRAC